MSILVRQGRCWLVGIFLFLVVLLSAQETGEVNFLQDPGGVYHVREPWFQGRSALGQARPHTPIPLAPVSAPAASKIPPETPVMSEVKGIFISADMTQPKVSKPGVHFGSMDEGVQRDVLVDWLNPYLGQSLNFGQVRLLTDRLSELLKEQGYLVVDAVTPKQDLSDGVLHVLLLVGKLEDILVNGQVPPEHLERIINRMDGVSESLKKLWLQRMLARLNWNPERSAQLIFRRGTSPGFVDLDFQVREPSRAWGLYGGFENTGTDTTKDERLYAGLAVWRNPLTDAYWNFEYKSAPNKNLSQAFSTYLMLPDPWLDNMITLIGAYSRSHPDIQNFTLEGVFKQLGIRYRMDHDREDAWRASSTAGLDWKESNSDLAFGGTTVSNTKYQILQAMLQHSLTRVDSSGYTQVSGTLTMSPGKLNAHNSNASFGLAQAGADSRYFYLTGNLRRLTQLNKALAWTFNLYGQWAGEPLISSEQLGLGGYRSVRGYEEYEVTVDKGLYMNNELRTQSLWLLNANDQPLNMTPVVFWDYAMGEDRASATSARRTVTLNSVGMGVDLTWGETMTAYGYVATQLHDSGQSDGRRNNKAHMGVRFEY